MLERAAEVLFILKKFKSPFLHICGNRNLSAKYGIMAIFFVNKDPGCGLINILATQRNRF
jgi:hypothetical protein